MDTRIDWSITPERLTRSRTTPGAIPRGSEAIRIEGPGAVGCVQGILTNDVEKMSVPGLVHGAVLTAKGMIITTLWCHRDEDGLTLIVPARGVAPLRDLLKRMFPPRLAKVTEAGNAVSVWWLTGGATPPDEGSTLTPDAAAPFDSIWLGPRDGAGKILRDTGLTIHPGWLADAWQALAGWPVLGREIDERTLPQEVRFDELGSVNYEKGCYVGQETVARIHFRGHPNRTLRAIVGKGNPPAEREVVAGDDRRAVGEIATLGVIGECWIGTAKLRREVEDSDTVEVHNRSGTVHDYPLPDGMFTG